MGIERSSLYHHYNKQQKKDDIAKQALFQAHLDEPRYGVRRLAIKLGWSQEKTRRIRNLANVTALRKRNRYRPANHKDTDAPDNKLKPYWTLRDESNPSKGYTFINLTDPNLKIWVQDFTYIRWKGRFCYLAASMNLSTRKIVGWEFGLYHDADLVCSALEDALSKEEAPGIAHNDQGSEYLSYAFVNLCASYHIITSASDAGEPWQNGFMERFFCTFKEEMGGKMKRAKTLEELQIMIAGWIHYYNHKRIHTSLKMTPAAYEEKLFHKEKEAKRN